MLNANNKKLRRGSALRRNKPVSVERRRRRARPTPKIIGERFTGAMLSSNKRLLDQILREIVDTFPPSESPEEFFGLMSGLFARTAHHAVKLHVAQEQLRSQALTDELTGLHNRRGFFALAGQQLKLARRNHATALLFFADINGLKQINDRFGHAEGDAAIHRVARALTRTFRDSDMAARLGGDEFAILTNEVNSHSQQDIMRRLKESLDAEGSRD